MKQKSIITVRSAAEQAFKEMPEIFGAIHFCWRVKNITGRDSLMDGTILRRLRDARADSLDYSYRCIDTEKALYEKVVYAKEVVAH